VFRFERLRRYFLPTCWINSNYRQAYGYRKGDADDYFDFLKDMQTKFSDYGVSSDRTLAKVIDEHNYKKFTIPALEKARKKRKKNSK